MTSKVDAGLIRRATDLIDRGRLIGLTIDLTDIPSPTGFEGDVARAYHEVLRSAGFEATLQPVGDERYNAIGRL